MDRIYRFLLSPANLGGCGIALVVVVLFLAGVIYQQWMVLALIGYSLGYLLFDRQAKVEHCPEGMGTLDTLAWLKAHALPRLSGEAQGLLQGILLTAEEVSPRLKALEAQGMVQAENRVKLKQTLTRYLPDVLEAYFKLPSLYAKSAKVANGQTPYDVLVSQLRMLNEHVLEVRDGLYAQNVNELLANAEFLKTKFQPTAERVRL